jgi:Leu/Phe-tRNA-protein transferase
MANRENTFIEITPEVLLKAYACGIFPMAESADDPALYWIEPDMRGIIPLEGFHVPARLARTLRTTPWTVWVVKPVIVKVPSKCFALTGTVTAASAVAGAKDSVVAKATIAAITNRRQARRCCR